MSEFIQALTCKSKSVKVPEAFNLFGPLVGEWDFEWVDNHGTQKERHVKGEWIFSWILEGTAIQDIFICPSRKERISNQQPDEEYGTTIRIYNQESQAWDIFYGCTGQAVRLEARREGEEVVLTEITSQKMKWIFSKMTENSFHWRHIRTQDGVTWKMQGELFATRKR